MKPITKYTLTHMASYLIQLCGWLLLVTAMSVLYTYIVNTNLNPVDITAKVFIALVVSGIGLIGLSGLIDAVIEIALNTREIAEKLNTQK